MKNIFLLLSEWEVLKDSARKGCEVFIFENFQKKKTC